MSKSPSKTKKINSPQAFEKLLNDHGLHVAIQPDDFVSGLYFGSNDGWCCSGPVVLGDCSRVLSPKDHFHWAKCRNIISYENLADLLAEDASNEENWSKNHQFGISEIRSWDGLNVGDVVCVTWDGRMEVYDDETDSSEEITAENEDDWDAEASVMSMQSSVSLVYIGDNKFISTRGITKKTYNAIRTLASLHNAEGLGALGINIGELEHFRKLTNKR